jgi:hypothetical protein
MRESRRIDEEVDSWRLTVDGRRDADLSDGERSTVNRQRAHA